MIFYLLAALLIVCAIMTVTQRGLFSSALYLAGALSLVGSLFILLGADFLFAVQILLYVGGIIVIIAFAVLLSNAEQLKSESQHNHQWIPSIFLCLGFILIAAVAIKRFPLPSEPVAFVPTTHSIGRLLLGDLILPFEVVSLVLLASLIGAVLFSRKEKAS